MKDQIQFETNGLTVLSVKVPEDAVDICLPGVYLSPAIQWYVVDKNGAVQECKSIDLPAGNWKLHAVTDSITEEQAEVILERASDKWDKFYGWKDYEDFYHYHDTWQESLHSLLRSHGIDPAEKWVLLVCE